MSQMLFFIIIAVIGIIIVWVGVFRRKIMKNWPSVNTVFGS